MTVDARVLTLDQLTIGETAMVGGKAAGCARLRQAGFAAPNGFVVLPPGMHGPNTVDLRTALASYPPGTLFAVRSSGGDEDGGERSFAGIHRTVLNVPESGLLDAIALCSASSRSAHADAYRTAQGLPGAAPAISVLVQHMVPADVAGVAFSTGPTQDTAAHLVINAAWGLGEAVASGQVDPDEFVVDRRSLAVLTRRIGAKQQYLPAGAGNESMLPTPQARQQMPSLTDAQIAALAALVLDIERAFNAPQDVEWCLAGDQLWVVQARPITGTAAIYPSAAWSRQHPDIEWSRATALESLPDLPRPQVSQAHCQLIQGGLHGIAPELLAPAEELGPVARVILGRLYFNVTQFKQLARRVGRPTDTITTAHGSAWQSDSAGAPTLGIGGTLRLVPRILRLAGIWPPLSKPAWADTAESQQQLEFLRRADPRALPDDAVWAQVALPKDAGKRLGTGVLDASMLLLVLVRSLCPAAGSQLERLRYASHAAHKTSSSQEGLDLLGLVQIARREAVTSAFFTLAQPDFADYRQQLQGTAFLHAFDTFLQTYGECGTFDKDWSLPRYREDPSPLLEIIRLHLKAPASAQPHAILARQQQELQDAWQAFNSAAGRLRGRLARPLVWWALRQATQFHERRERGRFRAALQVGASRPWHLALAERLVTRGWLNVPDDYFYLTLDEVRGALDDPALAAACKTLVRQRRADYEAWAKVCMPTVLCEAEIAGLQSRAAPAIQPGSAQRLEGLVVSNGSVSAPVVVVRSPSDFAKMHAQAIIVATATDPSWTPLFTLAGGVIAEVGGTLSHAATLARELGLPAVTNVRDATRELRDGDVVHLDASHGVVHILSRAPLPTISTGAEPNP